MRVAETMQSGSGFDRFYDVLEKIMFTDDGVGLLQRIPAVNIFNVVESDLTICKKTDKVIFCKIPYNRSSVSLCELVEVAAVQEMGLR